MGKKWIVKITFLAIFFSFLTGCGYRQREESWTVIEPIRMQTIVIDAGHGGKDPGSVNLRLGYEEKSLTLDTAQLVAYRLKNLGYHVILTRDTDCFLELSDRARIANEKKADLFVSIHFNHSPTQKVDGIEIFYYREKDQEKMERKLRSIECAKTISERLVFFTNAYFRGIKEGNFAVIRETKMPAVLVEAGFLSNPEERERIKDPLYRRAIAYGIAEGIDTFLQK